MSSRAWVYDQFYAFYNDPSFVFPSPGAFSQREFAFLLFKERAMVRHKSFASPQALRLFAKQRIPSDIYHSCAYYENPEAEMEKKGWQGADLVFDIDADHIPTRCNKIHDEWKCSNLNCGIEGGFSGKGITPDLCPVCGGVRFETKTWACELCIDSTRTETRKLLDILLNDFGFSESEIHTYFSGHRGYHIHLENETIKSLDSMARKEIVDYVSATGLDLFTMKKSGPSTSKKRSSLPAFNLSDYGWKRRLKRGIRIFIENSTKEDFREIGLSKRISDIISKKKNIILKLCIEENRWNSIKGVGFETWMRIAEHVTNHESAQIDTVVTSDIHRLIRANGTLHGKTGLLKIEFPLKDLDTFDPFMKAVAFKEGTAKVLVSEAPEFKLNGTSFGPFKNQKIELPTAAAILLILKGRAEVLNQNV